MTECKICSKESQIGSKFCRFCGSKLEISPKTLGEIDILKKKIENDNLNLSLYISLGDIYLEINAIQHALDQYYKALAINSKSKELNLKIAQTEIVLDNIDEAEKVLLKIYKENKKDKKIIKLLITIFSKQKKWQETIKFAKYIDIKDTEIDILLEMAKSQKELNNIDEAIKLYERALKLSDNKQTIFGNLLELYSAKEDYDKGIKILQQKMANGEADEKEVVLFIKYLVLSERLKEAKDLIDSHSFVEYQDLKDIYLAILYFREGAQKKAMSILNTFKGKGIIINEKEDKPIISTFIDLCDEFKKNKDFDSVINILHFLMIFESMEKDITNRFSDELYEIAREPKIDEKSKIAFLQKALEIGNKKAKNMLIIYFDEKTERELSKGNYEYSQKLLDELIELDPENKTHNEKLNNLKELIKAKRKKETKLTLTIILSLFVLVVAIVVFFKFVFVVLEINVVEQKGILPNFSEIQLYYDGKLKGTLDKNNSFRAIIGNHKIEIRHWQYNNAAINYIVRSTDNNVVQLPLTNKKGTLEITSNPDNAKVVIGERTLGFTPLIINALDYNNYEITLDKNDYYINKHFVKLDTNVRHVSTDLKSRVLFFDDFFENRNNWEINKEKKIINGEYQIFDRKDDVFQYSYLNSMLFSNFEVEIALRLEKGKLSLQIGGLAFRLQDTSGKWSCYYILISEGGYFKFIMNMPGKSKVFTKGNNKWTKSKLLNKGFAKNKIKVICDKSKFSILFNNKFQAKYEDTTYTEGSIALLAYGPQDVRFDYIKILAIDPNQNY